MGENTINQAQIGTVPLSQTGNHERLIDEIRQGWTDAQRYCNNNDAAIDHWAPSITTHTNI